MSTTDQEPTRDSARRKFDDVASLFGSIVPPAGSPVRPRVVTPQPVVPQASDDELRIDAGPRFGPPPTLRAPPPEPLQSMPAAEKVFPTPTLSVGVPTIVAAPTPVDPHQEEGPPVARIRQTARAVRKVAADVPWPDAFVPRPNYRPAHKSLLLYWLLIIPLAIVGAVAVTLVDPRAIRSLIDQTLGQPSPANIVRLTPNPATPEPVAPPPTPSGVSPAYPAASANAAPAPTQAAPDAVAIPPLAPSIELAPFPAAPAPPDTQAEAPPADPAAPTTAPISPASAGSSHVIVYYRRNQAGSEGAARRIAAKLGNAEIKPSTSTVHSPTLFYSSQADRAAATAMARTLTGDGLSGWIVRPGPARQTPGGIDIVVP